jgi:5'-methylthioadenosine phosphorylase
VAEVVSVASVGGIRKDIAPGVLMAPDQIIDYTWGRRSTTTSSCAWSTSS